KYHKYERGIKTNAWKRVADNIEVLLNAIQDEYKKEQFSKTFEENKLKDSDSIDEMQKKIEKIEELFRFVEFQYKLENSGLR
ncbi:peptidase S41, partial [Escherichia coli]|nr:peptidase S41 [Escherichia coli]